MTASPRRRGRAARPGLEALEDRLVLDLDYGFEVAQEGLFFTIRGSGVADTVTVWSDPGLHYFSIRSTDEDGEEIMITGSVSQGDIALAQMITGAPFVGCKLLGLQGNDRLDGAGTATNLFLLAGEGDDTLIGGSGRDLLQGDEGDDWLLGGAGGDTLLGGGGQDVLEGGGAGDTLRGGDGDDTLAGQAGADSLSGEQGTDLLRGDQHDVLLSAGTGGEAGAGDRFVPDDLTCTAGLILTNRDIEVLLGSRFGDRLDSALYAGPFPGVEVDGSGGDDLLVGSDGGDSLKGGDGDDTLEGRGTADVLDGGAGADTLSYALSPFRVVIDLRTASASGGDAQGDVFRAAENVTGSAHDDVLVGDGGANRLRGLAGSDLLAGGQGDDTLAGGAGDDQLTGGLDHDVVHGGPGKNSLMGSIGNDVLVIDAYSLNDHEALGGPGQDTFLFVNATLPTGGLDQARVGGAIAYLTGLRSTWRSDYSATMDSVSFPAVNLYMPLLLAKDVSLTSTPAQGGEVYRLRGAFSKPGAADSHTVTIDWGDGSPAEQIELPPGERDFEAEHLYQGGFSGVLVTVSDPDADYSSAWVTQLSPGQAVTVTVTASDADAAEAGLDPGEFMVTRTGDLSQALTVFYAVGGTALDGTDYEPLLGSVTFPAGSASAAVAVKPVDDGLVEGPETVVLTLTTGPGYSVGAPSGATVTIADDDAPPLLAGGAPEETDDPDRFRPQPFAVAGNSRTLPWVNISAADIIFSQGVVIDADDPRLDGVSVSLYGGTLTNSPGTHTAARAPTRAIDSGLLAFRRNENDASSIGAEGADTPGGVFHQRGDISLSLNVLPGDFTGDGGDVLWEDLDGDGDVDTDDIDHARGRLGFILT